MGDLFIKPKRPRRMTGPLVSDQLGVLAGLGDDAFE
jgi:hypothetical protein